jgi:hypothetical protein
MTLREHCTPEQLAAHSFLDAVAAGLWVHHETISRALLILGEQPKMLKQGDD